MSSSAEATALSSRRRKSLSSAREAHRNTIDKENLTMDMGTFSGALKGTSANGKSAKKTRSKSIGPGGVDALKDTTGNRRKSIAIAPRSILKPTLPPLRDSAGSNRANSRNDNTLANAFQMEVTSIINDRKMLEYQEAEAHEREIKERERLAAEIEARRAERRKSLANRRVSFAPEATLHTWDVIEYMQDSTTSSASTNSTRRASSIAGPSTPRPAGSDLSDPPSTPPEQLEDVVAVSPAHQRELHRRQRRRSSGIPPMNFNNPDDVFSSSPYSGSSDMDIDEDNDTAGGAEEDISDSDSDSMDEDETMMSLDGDDATGTMASVRSDASSTTSSAQLDANLRLASRQAGTQNINLGGSEPEEDEEVIASFAPWKKALSSTQEQENLDPFSQTPQKALRGQPEEYSDEEADMTMDMTRPMGGIIPGSPEEGMTMEMTRAVGRILPQVQSPNDGMTMDMTRAIGGILPSAHGQESPSGEATMEMTMEVTRAMGGILPPPVQSPVDDMTMDMTQAVGRILPHGKQPTSDEMTMEMTRAVGGILPRTELPRDDITMDMTLAVGQIIKESSPTRTKRSRSATARRQSTRRRSSAAASTMGEQTMDMTTAIGGIRATEDDTEKLTEDEDMSMEFTTAIGSVLPQKSPSTRTRRQSVAPRKRKSSMMGSSEEDSMDMTAAIGGIIQPQSRVNSANEPLTGMDMTTAIGGIIQPRKETGEELTTGMEMTMALGGILPKQLSPDSRIHAKELMELETDAGDLGSSPFRATPINSPARPVPSTAVETESASLDPFKGRALRRSGDVRQFTSPKPASITTEISETGSPAAFKGRGLRRSGDGRQFRSPKSASKPRPSLTVPATPTKQFTPEASRPTTPSPSKISPVKSIPSSASKKLFTEELKSLASPHSANHETTTPNKLFQRNNLTGTATPNIVLTPKRRRSSGIGIDRPGLGSPRVAALLDRRGSIGESSTSFNVGNSKESRGIHFEDPRLVEQEIDQERREDQDLENSRKILEREVDQPQDDKDTTTSLRGMIDALTPKKKSLNGRKSLHVGAAKGVLGKRPAELDDDEDEPEDGVKRLKGLQESPVKNIHLKAPPSKAETTGRMTRSSKSLDERTANITPTIRISPAKSTVTTPKGQGRFIDATAGSTTSPAVPLVENDPVEEPEIIENDPDDRIHLQDFLNLTSIRFMELTTTKRRHTVAPDSLAIGSDLKHDEASFESCVVAGACTVPMLELYQHSCRELKKYISEGRRIVREIEAETFEDNPPLFREYITAPPDVKVLMDNQFKNVKTHSRLLSKAMWYEWRMKLLENLINDGLIKTHDGLEADDKNLRQQEELIDMVLPPLIKQHEQLAEQENDLQTAAAELAECDQDELANARTDLTTLDADIEEKKRFIASLQAQLMEIEEGVESAVDTKQAYLEDIREAEKIREECRGWSANEVGALKDRVEALEKEYGWTITGISGTTTSMTYRREIELVFDAAAFRSNEKNIQARPVNSRIDLWYIAANRELDPLPLTMEKEFFLQSIRDHIRGLQQGHTGIKDLLDAVSVSWNQATEVLENIRMVNIAYPVEIARTSDSSILARSTMLLTQLTTKIEVNFAIITSSAQKAINIRVEPRVSIIYGEKFNELKMGEFLSTRIGEAEGKDTKSSWSSAMEELEQRLLARGRK